MLLGAVIAYLLLTTSRRYVGKRPTDEKVKTYACGEDAIPEEAHPDSEQFYLPIRRVLRSFYRYIQPAHTGVLSTYLLWAVVALVAILIAIWIVLG